METLCRLSYWGTADAEKASRERLQVDLLCDGETTRSAARIRNRVGVVATARWDAGVTLPRQPRQRSRQRWRSSRRSIGVVVGVERLLRRRLLPLAPIACAAGLVELARHLLEPRSGSREAAFEVGDALRDLFLAGGEHGDLTVRGAQLGAGGLEGRLESRPLGGPPVAAPLLQVDGIA